MKLVRRLPLIAIPVLALALAACDGDDGADIETDYPQAGMDSFENTTATVEVDVAVESVSAVPALGRLIQYELSGPLDVMRDDPGDSDSDGLADVKTTMVSMELSGSGSLGNVVVRLNPDEESAGLVEQIEQGQDFPASSFFDVFLEVELPDVDLTLVTEGPVRMEATLSSLPPEEATAESEENVYHTADGDAVPLITPTDAALRVGRIVDALHIPEPGPGPMPGGPTPTPEPEATDTATPEPGAEETPGAPPIISLIARLGCEHTQPGVRTELMVLITSRIVPGADDREGLRQYAPAPLVSSRPGGAPARLPRLGAGEPLVGAAVTARADGPGVIEGEANQSEFTDAEGNARLSFGINAFGEYTVEVVNVIDEDGNVLEVSPDSDTSFDFEVGATCEPPEGFE